jgi:hypothetical protein
MRVHGCQRDRLLRPSVLAHDLLLLGFLGMVRMHETGPKGCIGHARDLQGAIAGGARSRVGLVND